MPKNLWTEQELDKLKEDYRVKSIEELAELLGRGECGIADKLKKLVRNDPEGWDEARTDSLYNEAHRRYNANPKQYRREDIYSDDEIALLKDEYETKSAEELAELFGRGKYGIVHKLEELAKKEVGWSTSRIRELRQQVTRRPRSKRFWTKQEEKELRRWYRKKSLEELAQIIGRGRCGVMIKLKELIKKEPKRWNKGRINYLYALIHREYRALHPGQLSASRQPHKRRKVSSRSFAEREKEWRERDINILASTYFNHEYLELMNIFRLKDREAQVKLRELYEQDPDSWDAERIEELEKQAERCSAEDVRRLISSYSSEAFKIKGLRRRSKIDKLIAQGVNMRQVGIRSGISRQAVHQYIHSRGLYLLYSKLQNINRNQNKN